MQISLSNMRISLQNGKNNVILVDQLKFHYQTQIYIQ